jgi:predicted transcriptional regulator
MAESTTIEDQLSWALSRISELEQELGEARETIRRLIEGDPVDWEV